MGGTAGSLNKGRLGKTCFRAAVGGAQQNGMGFGNKNLLGETKGRNWCYSHTERLYYWSSMGRAFIQSIKNCCHFVLNGELRE